MSVYWAGCSAIAVRRLGCATPAESPPPSFALLSARRIRGTFWNFAIINFCMESPGNKPRGGKGSGSFRRVGSRIGIRRDCTRNGERADFVAMPRRFSRFLPRRRKGGAALLLIIMLFGDSVFAFTARYVHHAPQLKYWDYCYCRGKKMFLRERKNKIAPRFTYSRKKFRARLVRHFALRYPLLRALECLKLCGTVFLCISKE